MSDEKRPRGRPRKLKRNDKLLPSEKLLIGMFLQMCLEDASRGEDAGKIEAQVLGVKKTECPSWRYWSNVGSAIQWLYSRLEQRQRWYPAYVEMIDTALKG